MCCQVEVSATSRSLVQRSPIDCDATCVWSRNLKNEEAVARVGPQRHRKKKNTQYSLTIQKSVSVNDMSTTVPVVLLREACRNYLQQSLYSYTEHPVLCHVEYAYKNTVSLASVRLKQTKCFSFARKFVLRSLQIPHETYVFEGFHSAKFHYIYIYI